jgi:hypothetical protein
LQWRKDESALKQEFSEQTVAWKEEKSNLSDALNKLRHKSKVGDSFQGFLF